MKLKNSIQNIVLKCSLQKIRGSKAFAAEQKFVRLKKYYLKVKMLRREK